MEVAEGTASRKHKHVKIEIQRLFDMVLLCPQVLCIAPHGQTFASTMAERSTSDVSTASLVISRVTGCLLSVFCILQRLWEPPRQRNKRFVCGGVTVGLRLNVKHTKHAKSEISHRLTNKSSHFSICFLPSSCLLSTRFAEENSDANTPSQVMIYKL